MAFWLHQWIYPPFPPLLYRELRWEIESSGSNLQLHWGRHTTTTTRHRHATVVQSFKKIFKILCFKCTIALGSPLYHQPTQASLCCPTFEFTHAEHVSYSNTYLNTMLYMSVTKFFTYRISRYINNSVHTLNRTIRLIESEE